MNNTSKNNPWRFLKNNTYITKKYYPLHENHKFTTGRRCCHTDKNYDLIWHRWQDFSDMKSYSNHTTCFFHVILSIPALGLQRHLQRSKSLTWKSAIQWGFFKISLQENSAQCSVQRLFSLLVKLDRVFVGFFFMPQNKSKSDVTCVQLLWAFQNGVRHPTYILYMSLTFLYPR